MKDLEKKIEEAQKYLEQVRAEKSKTKTTLEQLEAVENQVLGRLQTYAEIQEESKPTTKEGPPVVGLPEDSVASKA